MSGDLVMQLPAIGPSANKAGDPPLKGVRIADFSHFVSGPYATMMLADMGADVIKIESPSKGDEYRYYGLREPRLGGEGTSFLWTNRNKRSVTIDLKSQAGCKAARKIIRESDVLVENFSADVMERLGFGYEECSSIRSDIIYCSVSAYGREGPLAERRGFDAVVQAESGFGSMTGYADSAGYQTDATVIDIATAVMASNAILSALIERVSTGKGKKIGISLFDTAMTMLGPAALRSLTDADTLQRTGNDNPDSVLTGRYACENGAFYFSCPDDFETFQRLFTRLLSRVEIASDERFRDFSFRFDNRATLRKLFQEYCESREFVPLAAAVRAIGAAVGHVNDMATALVSDESIALQALSRIPHELLGFIPDIKPPYSLSKTPLVVPVAAPTLGQHSGAVAAQFELKVEADGKVIG